MTRAPQNQLAFQEHDAILGVPHWSVLLIDPTVCRRGISPDECNLCRYAPDQLACFIPPPIPTITVASSMHPFYQ